jgi:DNA-binding MarR family transcriptional regulator
MNITRHKRPDIGWITISQTVFQSSLSAPALGILCYLLSMPDDWVVHSSQLRKRFDFGRDKMGSLLNEIIAHGFIQRAPGRRIRGRWVAPKYSVTDLPQPDLSAPVESAPY